jgi:hypothetical protein
MKQKLKVDIPNLIVGCVVMDGRNFRQQACMIETKLVRILDAHSV